MAHHELKQLEGGKIEVKLETGETFTGDPLEVNAKLADSKVETRRHYEAKEAALTQKEQELVAREQALAQQQQAARPVADPNISAWDDFNADGVARKRGFKNFQEMDAHEKLRDNLLMQQQQALIHLSSRDAAFDFHAKNPDCPDTPDAIAAMEKRIKELGGDMSTATADQLEAAHAYCIRKGDYEPLNEEEITQSWSGRMQADNKKKAPPMVKSNNPDTSQPVELNEWQLPMDELRKKALAAGKS